VLVECAKNMGIFTKSFGNLLRCLLGFKNIVISRNAQNKTLLYSFHCIVHVFQNSSEDCNFDSGYFPVKPIDMVEIDARKKKHPHI
jgi:hypothetical protein